MSQKSTNTQPRREEEYTEDSPEQTAVRAAPAGLNSESSRAESPEEFLDSSGDVAGFASEAPAPPTDASNDSMLSRYCRDMATHQVMGPDEELRAAQAVEQAEVDHWAALLAYVPVAERMLDMLDAALAEMNPEERPEIAQVIELRKLVKIYKKQRSKLHADQQRSWTELSQSLARDVRLPDSDRIWMHGALRLAKDAGRLPEEDTAEVEADTTPETPAYKRYLDKFDKNLLLDEITTIDDALTRPWSVTKLFWESASEAERKIEFVANPRKGSRHNRGCAVDLSLCERRTGSEVKMPSEYDEFSARAYPDYEGGTPESRTLRDLLRTAMEAEGFTVYKAEWWHFDYKDWAQYRILNTPFESIVR